MHRQHDQQLLRRLCDRYVQPDLGAGDHGGRPLQRRHAASRRSARHRASTAITASAASIRRPGRPTRSSRNLTAYAGYSEANRAPTAAELSCADPALRASLDNLLIADPPLKQVVARTYEAGLRGSLRPGGGGDKLAWNFGLYRTDNQDDIINVPSPITGRGFFQNAGNTRRQGIEAGIAYKHDRWSVSADYSLVDATFQSALTLNSPNNPFADANGQISVRPGNHLPSIPEHRLKIGTDYAVTESWTIGGSLVVASDQYLRGDESNQNPKIPGYAIVNLRSSYRLAEHFEIFGLVQNLFDQKYETFGSFFDPTQVPSLGLSNPRSLSPAAPLAAFGGVRISF